MTITSAIAPFLDAGSRFRSVPDADQIPIGELNGVSTKPDSQSHQAMAGAQLTTIGAFARSTVDLRSLQLDPSLATQLTTKREKLAAALGVDGVRPGAPLDTFPAALASNLQRAIDARPLSDRDQMVVDPRQAGEDVSGYPRASLGMLGSQELSALLRPDGSVYVFADDPNSDYGDDWWHLQPPPANVTPGPTPLLPATARRLPRWVNAKLRDGETWPVDRDRLPADLGAPIATNADLRWPDAPFEAYAFSGDVYVKDETDRFHFAGTVPSQDPIDTSDAGFDASVREYIRNHAGSDWIFDPLSMTEYGLQAMEVDGEGARKLIELMKVAGFTSGSFDPNYEFDGDRHRLVAVVTPEYEGPEVTALLVDRQTGEPTVFGYEIDLVDGDDDRLAVIPEAAVGGYWSSDQALYELLKDGKRIHLGGVEDGVDPSWSVDDYNQR